MRKLLPNDRSKTCFPGPTMGSRGELPYSNTLSVKAAALNQLSGPLFDTDNFCPGTRFGRSQRPSLFWPSVLCNTSNGFPLANVTMPWNDQPESNVLPGPFK